MEQKVCGIDVHRDTLVATILDSTNHKQTQTFQNNTTDMENLKNWLKTNNTIDVVMESVRPDRVRCEATKVLPRKITRETI
jgi:hypothetical protein